MKALEFICNPRKMCDRVYEMVHEITAKIKTLKMELKSRGMSMYNLVFFICLSIVYKTIKDGGVAQWVSGLSRNLSVVGSSPIYGSRCFLDQKTLSSLLSTG